MTTPTIDHYFRKAKTMSDFDLRRWLGYNEGSPMRAAAETELERRRFRETFFAHGIPSWFALIISVLSLSISAYVAFFNNLG